MALLFLNADRVRKEAGFDSNQYLLDDDVLHHINGAEAEVISAVGVRYDISLFSDSGFSGSMAESFLLDLGTALAVARLQYSQYKDSDRSMAEQFGKNLGMLRAELKKIQDGKIRLFSASRQEFDLVNSSRIGVSGSPQDSTDRMFRKSQVF
jgi:hypothetical protein